MRIAYLLLGLLFLASCINVYGPNEEADYKLLYAETGLAVEETITTSRQLIAKVKGSIYESGETVSVFGTCLDADQQVIDNITASFSAWYPNGTQFINETNVTEIQPGYYLYTSPMNAVQGTYLTQLRCQLDEQFALAWGEWQNPFWVQRINDTLTLVNATYEEVQIAQEQIENLSIQVDGGFNQTFIELNNTQVLITQSTTTIINNITYAAQVANNSVDRNDSLLAELLILLINNNGTGSGYFDNGLNITEDAGFPNQFSMWQIFLTVENAAGVQIGYPLISCYINTTNNPPTVAGEFQSTGAIGNPRFKYQEKIWRTRSEEFSWTTWCEYN